MIEVADLNAWKKTIKKNGLSCVFFLHEIKNFKKTQTKQSNQSIKTYQKLGKSANSANFN